MTDAPPPGDAAPAPGPAAASNAKSDAIDTKLVRRLADILRDTELTEIEVERGDLRVRVVRKPAAVAPVLHAAPAYAPPAAAAPPPSASLGEQALAAAEGAPLRETAPIATGDLVKSPMVGTIYLQAQPGSPAFAKVGDTVSEGQTLFIVEAMKTMNPIPAPRGGVIKEILVGDGQPIEFGEPLAVID